MKIRELDRLVGTAYFTKRGSVTEAKGEIIVGEDALAFRAFSHSARNGITRSGGLDGKPSC